ncbi:hypothetical protein DACRYDRAFT_21815 [Dacryopinax primogenitus]|uniref:Uncharacterized protein n=1 Tax=Dacryopinax primogenitus (strain DJM 731) TaxID=1858805 RepID=M5FXT9_DACPD|nr:uncharacterized protein DACRYDRAFT_21815 [Dacryopinax primogenitus]EJU02856.1 hypothetical protein DACRYDRAFT_21815 [Dacryopinax primogenitus]
MLPLPLSFAFAFPFSLLLGILFPGMSLRSRVVGFLFRFRSTRRGWMDRLRPRGHRLTPTGDFDCRGVLGHR